MNEVSIEGTECKKLLGLHLDMGTWAEDLDHICAKVMVLISGIFPLRNLAKYCSPSVLKSPYFGLIYPHLTYGLRLK